MNLLRKIKSWIFGPAPDGDVDHIMQLVVSRAFQTGNIVIANRRYDGSVEVEEIQRCDELLKDEPQSPGSMA